MKNKTDDLLSDLLARWHKFASSVLPVTGYYTSNAACKLYRCSRQYDDANGALDSDQENQTLEAVGYAIEQMDQPWKTAVEFNARNLALGLAVWRSPRLPDDDMERAFLVVEARGRLITLLQRDGLV